MEFYNVYSKNNIDVVSHPRNNHSKGPNQPTKERNDRNTQRNHKSNKDTFLWSQFSLFVINKYDVISL